MNHSMLFRMAHQNPKVVIDRVLELERQLQVARELFALVYDVDDVLVDTIRGDGVEGTFIDSRDGWHKCTDEQWEFIQSALFK